MSGLALGVAAALVALRCQLISDDPYVLGSVSRVLPQTRPAFLRALNQTRRLIGCPEVGDVGEPDPQFFGGQCPVSYRVVSRFLVNGVVTSQQTFGAIGPLGGVSVSNNGNVWTISMPMQGTVNVIGGSCSPPTSTQPGTRLINQISTSQQDVEGGIVSITRCDNQADNCGDLPPEYPPPTNFTTNIDVTYNIDDGTEVTVNLPFIFAPITANFDGSLRIPLTFDFGGLEFSGDLNLPDFNLTLNPPALPPGSGEDISEEGEDAPGESVEPAPPGEKIIGVVVNATQIDSRRVSSYSSPGITPIFVPRLGSIKFAYSIGIATFFSSDIDIKDRRTFIPCPFSQGADAVIASPNLGVDLTFTPIRGYPLATTASFPPPG